MGYSWGSMLRTIRAAVAVMLLGGLGLTLPPQTRDMLAFLDKDRVWGAISFQIALGFLAFSGWFWSRAALAARFGIDDKARFDAATANFNWMAFTWLPRFTLIGGFFIGAVIAYVSRSPMSFGGTVGFGILAIFQFNTYANPTTRISAFCLNLISISRWRNIPLVASIRASRASWSFDNDRRLVNAASTANGCHP